ncbi:MAG: hypothetical protein ABIJ37_03230 [Pseudomonadota bacterium]
MSKLRKRIDKNNDKQLSLFDILKKAQEEDSLPKAGSLNIDIEFRELISAELKKCPYSRYHVAGRMSELTGTEITKSMLDSWTAESKELHRFPAIFAPAFCISVESSGLLDFLGMKAGVFVLPGKEALRADIQKLLEQRDKINKGIKKRRALLDGLKEV